jgi:outer membrane receptor protein involved in Fe transport
MSRILGAPALALLGIAWTSASALTDQQEHAEQGAMANPAAVYELPTVEVVSTAPLPGMGIPLAKVPNNVQTLGGPDLEGRGYDTLSETLSTALGNVNVNDTQGNPYQMDVNVRGFTASPSLGTPQGVSVFVDGVRVNEAFGDVVNWDLIPQNAIANITLVPGANPQFGLNTLGGALSVVTKSGFQFPGTRVELDAGSGRRRQFQFESGGHGESVDYYVAGNLFRDSGWGDHNPSEVRQLFVKSGFQDDDTDIDLSLTLANNKLEGNQTIPLSFLDTYRQVYTYPDEVDNKLAMVNLKGSQYFGRDLLVAGGAYIRRVETDVLNSNINPPQDATVLAGNGVPCIGQEPFLPDCPNGQNIYNSIVQRSYGAAVQISQSAKLSDHDNTLIAGLSLDRGHTDFTQSAQDALVSADRGTFSSSSIVLGTALQGESDNTGLYASDTWSVRDDLALTVSGRYNHARVKTNFTYSDPASPAPSNGDFSYSRFNPAVGLNFNPSRDLTAYLSYGEGMRAPTPVELSCADPLIPCALPNAFASDPYLKKVISRTFEAGVRGNLDGGYHWTAAVFQTRLQDDILFISSQSNNATLGYFSNVGDTQRRGLELGLDKRGGEWTWGAHFSHLDARFESAFEALSPSNSAADAMTGLLNVNPGARIPGIPREVLKLQAHYSPGTQWSFGGSMVAQTEVFARGDESNTDVHGTVPGFAVFNLDARYRGTDDLEWTLHLRNLFDRRYSTFGGLNNNLFNQPGRGYDVANAAGTPEQFRSIGAPRSAWVSLTWWFDHPAQPTGAGADRD